jgi:thiol-disulfide isomerase/thioredoxin
MRTRGLLMQHTGLMKSSIAIILLATSLLVSMGDAAPEPGEPQIETGWLGVILDMEHNGPGARVGRPFPDSPAARAGVEADDLITEVNDQTISNNQALISTVGEIAAGTQIELTLERGEETHTLTVLLATRPENPANLAERLVGSAAPEVQVYDIESESTRALTPDDKKVRIIEFWATWCPACRHAMPELSEAVSDFSDDQFELLAVSGQDAATVTEFAQSHTSGARIVQSDNEEANEAYWVGALPSYFLIDRAGVVRGFASGANGWARLVEMAEELVEEAPEVKTDTPETP